MEGFNSGFSLMFLMFIIIFSLAFALIVAVLVKNLRTWNTQLLKIRMQNAWNGVEESYQQLLLAERSIEQADENLRLNRNYYRAGTSKMSDLLEAQLLYQQSLDKHTDAFADYQNKLLEYKQATGQ